MSVRENPSIRRPALRYHGGKWILAPWVISHFPPHRIYVEPYGGAASVLIRKPRSYAEVYGDLNDEVVNFFQVLRLAKQARELENALFNTPYSRKEFALSYQVADDPVERARRLVVRSFMSFGSDGHSKETGFRANSNRSGTTPAHDWVNLPSNIEALHQRLRGVVVECRSALETMAQHDTPETLHYVDPPYVHETRSKQRGKYFAEMTDDDHRELIAFLCSLKGKVILSGYPCELYDSALQSWRRTTRKALADGAKQRVECLWINRAADTQDLLSGHFDAPSEAE